MLVSCRCGNIRLVEVTYGSKGLCNAHHHSAEERKYKERAMALLERTRL